MLMLTLGRGRWAVSQKPKLINFSYPHMFLIEGSHKHTIIKKDREVAEGAFLILRDSDTANAQCWNNVTI